MRENGFYWVKMKSMLFPDGWQVAYWFQHRWMMVSSDETLFDEQLQDIDENMIEH